jgi:transcriptional regulator with XRE-family HTH domain
MNSIGAILREERERQGRETKAIAEELCITQRYLCAIEQDDLKSLPGSFFYKSFVRQYAVVLGIDEKVLQPGIDALVAIEEPVAEPEPIHHPSATAEAVENGRSPMRDIDPIVRDGNRRYIPNGRTWISIAGLAAALLTCSGFYAWWTKPPSASHIAARPADQAVAIPVASAGKPNAPGAIAVTTSTDANGVNHIVLNLSATEATWVSITADGKRLFSGILQPSQTKTLAGTDVAKMKVGNAGGIEVMWNGKPIGPIGPRGQVRDVLFTKDNFEIIQPSPAGTL